MRPHGPVPGWCQGLWRRIFSGSAMREEDGLVLAVALKLRRPNQPQLGAPHPAKRAGLLAEPLRASATWRVVLNSIREGARLTSP